MKEIDQDAVEIACFSGFGELQNLGASRRTAIENRVQPAMIDGGAARRGSL